MGTRVIGPEDDEARGDLARERLSSLMGRPPGFWVGFFLFFFLPWPFVGVVGRNV